jgi:JAB domain-containing protein similar to deubiquitination enzymes
MLLTWAAVLAILSSLPDPSVVVPVSIPAVRELARDPVILEGLWDMLGRAQYGFSHLEEAAFVLAAPDGTLSLMRWPGTGRIDQSYWRGPLPRNAVAIVHTHPNSFPKPSRIDARTSITTGLPVYVITRSSIMKTNGSRTEVVSKKPWIPGKHNFPSLLARRSSPVPAPRREGSALLLRENGVQREHDRE